MGKLRLVLLAAGLIAASCASSDTVVSGGGGDTGPIESSTAIDALGLRCGSVSFPDRSIDLDALPRFTEELAAFVGEQAASEFDVISDGLSGVTFYEVERTDTRLVLFGERSGSATGSEPYFDAAFENRDGAWRASGWGDCWMVVEADGFGVAELALDPANQPTASASSLALLATERSCASGQLPEGRQVQDVVVESEQSVQILVLVEEQRGFQNCQGNPAFPITVDLARPLGDRTIVDSAFSPPTELVWPIPPRPSQLRIVLLGDAPANGTVNVVTYSGPDAARLRVHRPVWGTEPGEVIALDLQTPRVITGFVAECKIGTCLEQCEETNCDTIDRLTTPCEANYEVGDLTKDTIVTVTFSGADCVIDIRTAPID